MSKKENTVEAFDPTADHEKALELAISSLEKNYGLGTIMRGEGSIPGVEFLSTGCLSLNRATGGGYPKGRIIEIFGPESSGKTTLALHAIAEAQKLNGMAAFVDAEHAFDPDYATALGVDVEKLLFSQPDTGEEALEIVETLTRTGAMSIIVLDSVAALVPRAEIEGEMGDQHMGLQARLMSQAMRKLAGIVHKTNTLVIFINQIRMKIGVMFGNPETVAGGNALKFYSSQRIDVRRTGSVKGDEQVLANTTRAKIVKNKVAPPFKEAEFNIVFGRGIDAEEDLLKIAVDANIVEKSGSWYSYNGSRIGQGTENSCEWLRTNPEAKQEIYDKLIK